MSETNWRELGAGRELDQLVAERIFGFTITTTLDVFTETEFIMTDEKPGPDELVEPWYEPEFMLRWYSTSPTDAALVLAWVGEKCKATGWDATYEAIHAEKDRQGPVMDSDSYGAMEWLVRYANQPLLWCRVALQLAEEASK